MRRQSLPAPERHASEEVIDATAHVADLIRADIYDGELLHQTERLVHAHATQDELRLRMLDRAARALTPEQRRKLSHMVAEQHALE